MLSFRNSADSATPNTGTMKLKAVTMLTRLYLSSRLQMEMASDESTAM